MKRRPATILSIIVVTQMLAGCAAVRDFLAPLSAEPIAQPAAPAIRERVAVAPINANRFVLETPEQSVVGEPQYVLSKEENTLSEVAREYGLGYDEIVEANPDVNPWLPGDGTLILLPTQFVLPSVPRKGIVLNIATKRLFYFPEPPAGEPQTVLTYPIGIGRVGWETPLGHSAVVSKATDPHWWVPASVRQEHEEMGDPLPAVVPPGPDNPLGRHVLKLDLPGYLIHGTNQPYGVGMRVSHGCVRLYPENIETLYELADVGETVTIVNEPYLIGQRSGRLYFEAHPPLEDDPIPPEQHLSDIVEYIETTTGQPANQIILGNLRESAAAARGVPVSIDGDPVQDLDVRALMVHNTVVPDPDMMTLEEVRAILDAPLGEEAGDEASASAAGSETDE